jgi:carbon storage regulator
MLILTRKVGETLILDDDIEITVTDIQGNHAKLGINAPEEVKVYREEIYENLPDYLSPPYG